MTPGPYALLTGSGKDATLALHRGRAEGLDVTIGASLFDAASGRIAFHGTPAGLVRAQHEALGLESVVRPVGPEGFDAAFAALLAHLVDRGVRGVVLGNIHLEEIRAWYGSRLAAADLEHVEPLWGERPADLAREVVDLGYSAVVVSVMLAGGDPEWLGRTLDHALVAEIEAFGADPCGERGEYHTFVHAGPLFRASVSFRSGPTLEMKGHRLLELLEP